MTVLTYEDINDICSRYLRGFSGYGIIEETFFQLLYCCGCRPVEPMTSGIWGKTLTEIVLIPLKNGQPTYRNIQQFPAQWAEWIGLQPSPFTNNSLDKYRYIFNSLLPTPPLFVGEKGCDLYLFRYRYVKYLFSIGYSAEDVRVNMGWTTYDMADRYNNAVIYYN